MQDDADHGWDPEAHAVIGAVADPNGRSSAG
jgi:hypothetical protein